MRDTFFIKVIVGCLLVVLIAPYDAWAEPIGYAEMQEVEVADNYLSKKGISVSTDIRNICEEYGLEYDICPEILMAICWRESRFKPEVENGNCKGLMQVNCKVHSKRMKRLGVTDIFDKDGNIHTGADYLATLMEMNGDLIKSLNEYSGRETSKQTNYTKEIIEIASALDKRGCD